LWQFASFLAAVSWYFCARALAVSAVEQMVLRIGQNGSQPLLEAACLFFLLVTGLALLRRVERRRMPLALLLGLPRRRTAGEEWATGLAIGWGLAVAAILPMTLAGALDIRLWTTPHSLMLLGLSLAALGLSTLAKDIGIHVYAFQRLIDALGPVRATVAMAVFAGIYAAIDPAAPGMAIVVSVMFSVLLSLCWLRTQAVWVMWGLHFAWAAATAAVFGLPLDGYTSLISVVDTRALGPVWLTGGDYGPAAAVLSALFAIVAVPVLLRVTSDWAWDYTHPPIIPAGYDVTLPPPAAHVAMEQAALQQGMQAQPVNPASLVQILPATPPSRPE